MKFLYLLLPLTLFADQNRTQRLIDAANVRVGLPIIYNGAYFFS